MTRIFFAVVAVSALLISMRADASNPPEKPSGYFIRALEAMASVSDYTATMITQESKGSQRTPEETILFKFKKPFGVYMKWVRRPNKGREVLFVKGKYNDKIIAHEGGLLGLITVSVDPNSKRARDSGDSITDAGIQRFLEITLGKIRTAEAAGRVRVSPSTQENLFGRATEKVEFRFSGEKESESEKLVIHFDRESHLPIQWVSYDSRGRFQNKTALRDLKVNAGLSERDFDRKNPAYRFR